MFTNYNYYLSSNSPCIDSGDPNSIADPDGTIADIGVQKKINRLINKQFPNHSILGEEDSIIKKGLTTSEGWNEKLNIFNHLLAPFTWYSEKNKVIKSKVRIIKPNKANLKTHRGQNTNTKK